MSWNNTEGTPASRIAPTAATRLAVIGPVPPWQGGIAQHTGQLCERLANTHELLVISFASMYPDWLYPGPTNQRNTGAPAAGSATRFIIRGMDPRSWRKVVNEIAEFAPAAVILPWWTVYWAPFCLYAVRALQRHDIPSIFLCHNVSDHESAWWKQRLATMALSRGTAFITHTKTAKSHLRALLPAATISVYPHPRYQHFPAALQLPPRRAVLELLFFGYVRHYKGVDLLIDALGGLKELDFHLQISGEFWVDEARLCDQIARLGLTKRVTLTPHYVSDQQAAGLFTRADALILPYREASGSGVAALALHYLTPVIASRVGGLAEAVVEGETGYLVPPGDPAALAASILRLRQPRDWQRRIAAHQQSATWEGLAATVDHSIAASQSSRGAPATPSQHARTSGRP